MLETVAQALRSGSEDREWPRVLARSSFLALLRFWLRPAIHHGWIRKVQRKVLPSSLAKVAGGISAVAQVRRVFPDTPASRNGVRAGDQLYKVNGQDVTESARACSYYSVLL